MYYTVKSRLTEQNFISIPIFYYYQNRVNKFTKSIDPAGYDFDMSKNVFRYFDVFMFNHNVQYLHIWKINIAV